MNMAVFHNTLFTKTGGRSDLAHILVFDLVFDLDQGLDQDSKVNAKQNSNNYLGYLLKTGLMYFSFDVTALQSIRKLVCLFLKI